MALVAITGKILFEMTTGRMIFATMGKVPVTLCVSSHIAGASIALLFYGRSRIPAIRSGNDSLTF